MMMQPMVWRREQASNQVQNGHSPIMFRRDAGDNADSFVHRAALIACMELVNVDGSLPSWEQLAAVLPTQVVEPLTILIDEGCPCEEIVSAFIDALADCIHPPSHGRRLLRSVLALAGIGQTANDARRKVAAIVKAVLIESSRTYDIPAFLHKQAD